VEVGFRLERVQHDLLPLVASLVDGEDRRPAWNVPDPDPFVLLRLPVLQKRLELRVPVQGSPAARDDLPRELGGRGGGGDGSRRSGTEQRRREEDQSGEESAAKIRHGFGRGRVGWNCMLQLSDKAPKRG